MHTDASTFDPFPPDGDWANSDWVRSIAASSASPATARRAIARLRPILHPDWVRGLDKHATRMHPFTWQYFNRGGVREILTLGRCLDILGAPDELTKDLKEPSRYLTRSNEAWSGALFTWLGAHVEYIPENLRGEKPEFLGTFPDGQVVVENKGLDRGALESAFYDVNLAFQRGIWDALAQVGRALVPSRAIITPPTERLAALAHREATDREDQARAPGRDIGAKWVAFAKTAPPPGDYLVDSDLRVIMLPPERAAQSGQTEMSVPLPPGKSYFNRLRRNALKHAAKKFHNFGPPGIVVVEKLKFARWDQDAIAALEHGLRNGSGWAAPVAALFVRYDAFGAEIQDAVHVLPGPRWRDLPASLRAQIPKCGGCGQHHFAWDALA